MCGYVTEDKVLFVTFTMAHLCKMVKYQLYMVAQSPTFMGNWEFFGVAISFSAKFEI